MYQVWLTTKQHDISFKEVCKKKKKSYRRSDKCHDKIVLNNQTIWHFLSKKCNYYDKEEN